jgi:TonB-linked SusC/RagA family outer membrane protein
MKINEKIVGCRMVGIPYQLLRIMKLTILIMTMFLLQVSAATKAQITLNENRASLQKVLKSISKQSGYDLIYSIDDLKGTKPVNIKLNNESLEIALQLCFADQPLVYEVSDKTVMIKRKEEKGIINRIKDFFVNIDISGKVVDEKNEPLVGASIVVKGSNQFASSASDGTFTIKNVLDDAIIIISFVGYQPKEVKATKILGIIALEIANSQLDQVVVQGYGTTTQRLSTGNIAVVKSETIAQQAGVTNVMQALIGRMAGVQATQVNGMPGSGITIQIRGRNSINASNDPLYIVDGVPFSSNFLASLPTSTSISPLNSINPNDIESISVLKDADATAIYGSRGANGVVIITTKKGQQGKLKVDANINNSYGSATRLAPLMNTEEYLQYRRDAFANSNVIPTTTSAPDLISWDANANTNLQKMYFDNTAKFWDGNFSFSGGNQGISFLLATGLHKESTIRSHDDDYKRGNVHLNMNYNTPDNKFKLSFNGFFSSDKYFLTSGGASTIYALAQVVPNYPYYDASGNYNWLAGLTNYLAVSNMYFKSSTDNLNTNIIASYDILQGLQIKTSLGLNKIENDIMRPQPAIGKNPNSTSPLGSSAFGSANTSSFIFEPQILYNYKFKKLKFEALLGGSLQSNKVKTEQSSVSNYINDLLIESVNGGTLLGYLSNTTLYKYVSVFSRVSFNWENKYLLNTSFRRDGSTRFGPGKQFGDFYSLGAGWLFSNENFLKDNSILSYGKLRASYGTTGSDGIGDYQYFNIYQSSTNYIAQPTIVPLQIANPDFQWEVNRKFEAGLELGFFKDRLLLNASYYQNRSSNQLVIYPLSSTTGFTGYTANLPAKVQNTGWEFEINTKNINKGSLAWSTTANITIPRNKLLSFPGIELTSYANTKIVGKSLNSVLRYQFLGIDPQTGLAQTADTNGDNVYTARSSYNNQGGDYIYAGYTGAKWFGGLGNNIKYKNFELDFFFQYTKQDGYNIFNQLNSTNFGRLNNSWRDFLEYWKQPGDVVNIPKPMASANNELTRFGASTATFTDASFLRLKNISLSYIFPSIASKRIGITNLKVYMQGLNTITITNYKGYDPEGASSTLSTIPSLKMWTFGLQAVL